MQALGGMTSDHRPKCRATPQSLMSSSHASNNTLDLSQESAQVRDLSSRFDVVEDLVKEGHPEQAWVGLANIVREAQLIEGMCDSPGTMPHLNWDYSHPRSTFANITRLETALEQDSGC